jgi:tetratricopeptide (TPR) repeat protein
MAAFDRRVSEERLPDAAASIAADLRRGLGESAGSVEAQPATLEKATTPSLEALYAFSAGMKSVNDRQWRPAAELMEEALKKDPDFALAHVYLAYCYRNLQQEDQAAPHFDAAFRLASGVHERERLFILGSYYARRMHDDRRALGLYEAQVKTYPDDFWGVNNLAAMYRRLGMTGEWMATQERLVVLRPNDPNSFSPMSQLWWYYRRAQPDLGKARQYKELLLRLVRAGSVSTVDASIFTANLELETAADRWWMGDVKGAGTEVDRLSAVAAGKRDEYLMRLAQANEVLGKVQSARDVCGHVRDATYHNECLLRVAYVSDDRTVAEKLLNDLRIASPSEGGRVIDSWIAGWFDQTALARNWIDESPPNAYRYPARSVEALFRLKEGRQDQAILKVREETLDSPSGQGYVQLWMRMVQASALEQQGKSGEALTLLEQEIKPAHADFSTGYPWPKARLQLADLYRKAGRASDAARVEDEIRHFLSEADADHPVLVRLRSRK